MFCFSQREALAAACGAYIRFVLAAFEGVFASSSSLFSYLTSYHYQELEYQINDTLKASIANFVIGRISSSSSVHTYLNALWTLLRDTRCITLRGLSQVCVYIRRFDWLMYIISLSEKHALSCLLLQKVR